MKRTHIYIGQNQPPLCSLRGIKLHKSLSGDIKRRKWAMGGDKRDGWCIGKLSTNMSKVKDRDELKTESKESKEWWGKEGKASKKTTELMDWSHGWQKTGAPKLVSNRVIMLPWQQSTMSIINRILSLLSLRYKTVCVWGGGWSVWKYSRYLDIYYK